MAEWNPWHGCVKKSEGCVNCYVYRRDGRYELDASKIYKTKQFDLPIRRNKKGLYVLPPNQFVWLCFTSDFLLDAADEWRKEAWSFIRERKDCHFLFITKRIERFNVSLPSDWGEGYDNVTVGVTCENQLRLNERLPILKSIPIKHKILICEPLLTPIDLFDRLDFAVEQVVVGGESGLQARPCNFDWVKSILEACVSQNVSFWFKQTGYRFIKDGKQYLVPRKYQHIQAKKANVNYSVKNTTILTSATNMTIDFLGENDYDD